MVRTSFLKSLYHLESIEESDEFLVPVTLNLRLDEVTNWFNMSHVTPPVELNEIIQQFETVGDSGAIDSESWLSRILQVNHEITKSTRR
jgi:hypothetical protein